MSEELDARAEVAKLSRLLGRDASELDYLTSVPAADLRVLRDQITDVLFSAGGPALGKLAAGSRLLPVQVVASLGQHVFGAVIAARIAGMLEPERAVEMAARLPDEFLADVAVHIDPRRASDVISRIPPPRVAAVSRELTARGEYIAMGAFVGHLRPDAIKAAIDVMDERALLNVGFVLEQKDKLAEVVALLGEERAKAMIAFAADDGLEDEALEMIEYLSDEQRAIVADEIARIEHARDGSSA
jgi:hypothetical protein